MELYKPSDQTVEQSHESQHPEKVPDHPRKPSEQEQVLDQSNHRGEQTDQLELNQLPQLPSLGTPQQVAGTPAKPGEQEEMQQPLPGNDAVDPRRPYEIYPSEHQGAYVQFNQADQDRPNHIYQPLSFHIDLSGHQKLRHPADQPLAHVYYVPIQILPPQTSRENVAGYPQHLENLLKLSSEGQPVAKLRTLANQQNKLEEQGNGQEGNQATQNQDKPGSSLLGNQSHGQSFERVTKEPHLLADENGPTAVGECNHAVLEEGKDSPHSPQSDWPQNLSKNRCGPTKVQNSNQLGVKPKTELPERTPREKEEGSKMSEWEELKALLKRRRESIKGSSHAGIGVMYCLESMTKLS